jgi:hypothetical protein
MSTGKFQTIYKESTSIFTHDGAKALSQQLSNRDPKQKSAGLGPSNQMHNFITYNNDKSRPCIFANLLKNSLKKDDELRKKIEIHGCEKQYYNFKNK